MLAVVDQFFSSLLPTLQALGFAEAELQRGVDDLKIGAMRLALEVVESQRQGHSLADAVRAADAFPLLNQAHNAVLDMLTLELPREFQGLVRELKRTGCSLDHLDGLQRDLGRLAASTGGPEQALARFVLFEVVRLGLLLAFWEKSPDLHRVGVSDREWDERAEANLDLLLAEPADLEGEDGVRPLHVALSATLLDLLNVTDEASRALARLHEDLRQQYERRAQVEEALLDADARDAVLIRNACGPAWGEQRLEVPRLIAQHGLAFRGVSRAAADQRFHRRKEAMLDGGLGALPARRRPALIDLIREEVAS